ncbi:MAG: c-type cytochrome [Burkholderiales bacterium]
MKKKLLFTGLALALGAGYALTAFSQAKPEVLVKQRQSAMTLQLKYFLPLALMAQGKIPYDGNVVTRNAAFLDTLTQMPWDGFAESTKGQKSGALPAVFADMAKFKQSQDQLRTAVGALVAASKGGNEGAVKAAVGDVNKACGNCHDNFRAQ